uniref:THAP-type domain-containing protein n=1 Tax=Cacopsylla melanoneura TaxID=428564 RepID=A0A8D8V2M4_9HEMI
MSGTYRYCVVPMCQNTSTTTPDKVFLTVPMEEKRRKQWFVAMRRSDFLQPKTAAYICADHFDLENDMENYIRWTLQPRTHIILKPGVCPHKFECQAMRTEMHPIRRPRNLLSMRKEEEERKRMVEEMIDIEDSEEIVDDPDLMLVEEVLNEPFDPEVPSTSTQETSTSRQETSTSDKGTQVRMKVHHFRSTHVQCSVKCEDKSVQTNPKVLIDAGTNTPVEKLKVGEIFSSSDEEMESIPTDSEYQPSSGSNPSSNTLSAEPEKKFLSLKKRVQTNTMLYIGVPTNASFLIDIFTKYCKCPERNIYLCLKKMRLNEPYAVLSYEFELSLNISWYNI